MLEFIGFIFISAFIWARFIYKRLPKDIPFNLSLMGFISLLIICLMYMYIIYKMYKPSLSNNWKNITYFIATHIIKPLLHFNHLLLSYKIMRQIIKILLKLLYMLFKIQLTKDGGMNYIYIFIYIMPKVIFAICLIIDCFYFKQLYLIYTCIIILTFPIILQYLLFSYETIKTYDFELIDKYFIIEITSEDIIYKTTDYNEEGFLKPENPTHFIDPSNLSYDSLDDSNKYKYLKTSKFIKYQQVAIVCENLLYEYDILFLDERKDAIYLEKPLRPFEINKNICNALLQFHIEISVLKDIIITGNHFCTNDYLILKALLITINLICWCYILFISLYHLKINIFESIYVENIYYLDPFSHTKLDEIPV